MLSAPESIGFVVNRIEWLHHLAWPLERGRRYRAPERAPEVGECIFRPRAPGGRQCAAHVVGRPVRDQILDLVHPDTAIELDKLAGDRILERQISRGREA